MKVEICIAILNHWIDILNQQSLTFLTLTRESSSSEFNDLQISQHAALFGFEYSRGKGYCLGWGLRTTQIWYLKKALLSLVNFNFVNEVISTCSRNACWIRELCSYGSRKLCQWRWCSDCKYIFKTKIFLLNHLSL